MRKLRSRYEKCDTRAGARRGVRPFRPTFLSAPILTRHQGGLWALSACVSVGKSISIKVKSASTRLLFDFSRLTFDATSRQFTPAISRAVFIRRARIKLDIAFDADLLYEIELTIQIILMLFLILQDFEKEIA